MPRRGPRVKLVRGVYRDDTGIAAVACVGTLRREKRFPPKTALREIRRWLNWLDELQRLVPTP